MFVRGKNPRVVNGLGGWVDDPDTGLSTWEDDAPQAQTLPVPRTSVPQATPQSTDWGGIFKTAVSAWGQKQTADAQQAAINARMNPLYNPYAPRPLSPVYSPFSATTLGGGALFGLTPATLAMLAAAGGFAYYASQRRAPRRRR